MQKRVHGNLFVNDKSGECIVNECIGIEDEIYIKNYNNLRLKKGYIVEIKGTVVLEFEQV